MRYVWCTWLRASVFTETKRGGVSLLSISNLHRSLRKREQICDRADRAIRANVRGRIYQVRRAEKSNITAEYGRARSRTSSNSLPTYEPLSLCSPRSNHVECVLVQGRRRKISMCTPITRYELPSIHCRVELSGGIDLGSNLRADVSPAES